MVDLHWEETPDDKSARVDKILALNSQTPLVCVSCLEIITDRETVVPGPMGPYHGYPYTCVEGRKDGGIPWYQK